MSQTQEKGRFSFSTLLDIPVDWVVLRISRQDLCTRLKGALIYSHPNFRWALFLLVLFGLVSCGYTRTAVFPPEQSDILVLERHAAGRGYEILGIIQIDGRHFSTRQSLLDRLLEKARELGADEVVNERVLSVPRGKGFLKYHLPMAEGIAVRWGRLSRRE